MTQTEFQQSLSSVGISKESTATLFGVSYETVQQWDNGDKPVPHHVALGLELLIKHKIPARTDKTRDALIDRRIKGGNWKASRR